MKSATLACLLLLAISVATCSAGSLTLFLFSPSFSQAFPAYNTTCKAVDDGTVYYPSNAVSEAQPFAIIPVPDGYHDCTVDQPGYYRFTDRIGVGGSNKTGIYFYAVPVSYGLTFVNDFTLGGAAFFMPNMTFPSGAFSFGRFAAYLSVLSGSGTIEPFNYGKPNGPIPSMFMYSTWAYSLLNAVAGTYHFSVETLHIPAIPPYYPTGIDYGFNFLNTTTRILIFGGADRLTGHVATITSALTEGKSWHAGSIQVENPGPACSKYTWHTANTYSNTYGVHPDAPLPTGSTPLVLLEECFDTSPAALSCNSLVFPEDAPVDVCGAFGDPHFTMFNGTGVSCGRDSSITLVDNEYFTLVGHAAFQASTSATTIRSVTFSYKSSCNPTTVTFNDMGSVTAANIPNSPIALRHMVRISGNNIYVDAIRLRVQVRFVSDASGINSLIFGVSMPKSLVSRSTGACTLGCPAGTEIDLDAELSSRRKRDSARMEFAQAACDGSGLTAGSFEHKACLFDVGITGDDSYVSAATTSRAVRSDVATKWQNAGTPPPGSNASSISASLFVAFFAIIAMFCIFA